MHLKYKSGSSWIDYNLVVYPVGAYYFSSSSTSPSLISTTPSYQTVYTWRSTA